jgi:hypothetical protein
MNDKVKDDVPDVIEEIKQDEAAEEAAYEAEFNRLAAKREAEKDGTATPAAEKEPEDEPAKAADPEPSAAAPVAEKEPAPDELLTKIADPAVRDALALRLREAEEAKDRAKKLELDNRSMAGRMSAYQRRYEEAAGKRPAEVQAEATVEQVEEWTKFAEDYPDIAKAIEARIKPASGRDPKVEEVVEYVEQEMKSRFLTEAWEAVEAVHAGWRELGKTPEFQEWMKSSPTYGKLASSDDVADAIALFDLYKGTHPVQANPNQATATEAANAAKLAARRSAQAEGARAPAGSSASPTAEADTTSDDALFAAYAEKANKRLRARYG